ncbi:copper amine oxidase N-terminal domain-containing protein [Paenibacillus turicensis]|uniref:stalk domain-containing protein n=1 Tax=Paenibacillus turicensis TaxID=160487 RepID=UPI003D2CFF17
MRGADKVKAKKLYAALLAGSLVIPVLFQTPVEAAPKKQIPITININGDKLPTDVDPIMIKGRVMLPLRAIFEQLGASVSWEPKQRKITAYKDGVEMILYLDSKVATINGTKVSLDVAPLGYKARTMVPVRFVSEALGQSVSWQTSTRTVTILTTEDPGNNNNTPPSNNTINPVLNITLSDVANYGDGRDLRVSFGKSTTESLVQSYNVYIVKASSANNFNITSATRATSAGNYTNILATGTDPSTVLSSGAKDVDGDLIRNGQSYVAYVLAVGKGNISNVLSARSSQVTLTNGQSVGVATNVVMSDVSDYGDGRDLSVSFTRPQLDSNIANYRVFIVKTKDSNTFTLAKAVGASSQYYTTVNKSTSSSLKVTLSSSARDTSGDLIKNGVSYTAFVLSVSNNTNTLDHKLSNPSSSLVLNQGTLTAPAITKVEDISDYGDGRDLRVSFNKVSDESRISGYRVFVVKNSKQSNFNLSQANYVSSANYTSVNKTNYNLTQTLSYNTRDTDGDLIRNNISYRVFVMAVGTGTYNGTNTLSSASSLITLNTNAGAVERVSGLYVNDVADYGDGRDLQVSFTKLYNESNISEYRVFVVPTYYGNFDLNQANSLSSYYYTSISKRNANITQVLSSSARDVRGNLIQNNVDYQVYVMSVRNSYSSGDNALSYASSTIRLGNNASVSAVTNLLVADIADFSDGRDLQVRFSPSSNENNLSRYQVYVVKTSKANSFNLTQANSNRYYTTFYKTGSQVSGTLNSDARDTDGDRIQQGVPYTVFVLSVSNSNSSVNNVLSNGSSSITLTDSSVVQAVSNLSASISGNTGTFGDIKVSFTRPSNETNINEYRILVIPSSESSYNYSVDQAINVASGNYTRLPVGTTSGDVNSNDIFGASAVSGKTYEIRVLTVGKDGKYALSRASNQIIMKAPPVQELPTVAQVDASKVNVVADNSTGTISLNVSFSAPNDSNINSFTVVALPSASGTLPIDNIKKGFQANLNGDKYFALLTSDMNEQTIDVTKPYDLYIVSNATSAAKSSFTKLTNVEIKTGQ